MGLPYEWLRFVKLLGVLAYAGGVTASLLARELEVRRHAVHRVASPGLLVIWVGGFLLADTLMVRLREPWLLGAFALTFVAQGALTWSVADEGRRRPGVAVLILALVTATLGLMVWRPTWGMFGV